MTEPRLPLLNLLAKERGGHFLRIVAEAVLQMKPWRMAGTAPGTTSAWLNAVAMVPAPGLPGFGASQVGVMIGPTRSAAPGGCWPSSPQSSRAGACATPPGRPIG
ncbi:hypothetical protein E2C06_23980 [Dankookia rubra]|uniref:Uncharacterized protein n=1 Tax=Dankookia rubra TaxID=1442381 RepID=A0A4R5QBJ2_9PROT|nr:hypothetical protein E2C06_23980 [Dankookia rubra]